MEVSVRIDVWAERDPYARFFTYSVDEPIPKRWREWRTRKVISRRHSVTFTVDLPPGSHFVEVAVSSPCREPYYWKGRIYIDDKLIAEGKICGAEHLRGNFTIGTPTKIPWSIILIFATAVITSLVLLWRRLK